MVNLDRRGGFAFGSCRPDYCILIVMRARKAGLDEDAMRAQLARVLPFNMGALFLSVVGLMMVVVGVLLSSESSVVAAHDARSFCSGEHVIKCGLLSGL